MPIFRVNIAGRKEPLLVRGDSAGKVKDALVTVKALTAKELADAFGEPVWSPGDDLPAEPAPDTPPPADDKPTTGQDENQE